MTIHDIIDSKKTYLSAADVAYVLQCDPQSIRAQAQEDPSKLGFPIIVIGRRIRIPRTPFLHFLGVI